MSRIADFAKRLLSDSHYYYVISDTVNPLRDSSSVLKAHLLANSASFELRFMRRGTGVFEENSPSDRIFFLSSGLVKLVRTDGAGRSVLVGIVRPGELFGDQEFFAGGDRESHAEVLADAEVFSIPRDAFFGALDQSPELWREVAVQLANRARALERQVELVALHTVEDRILLQLKDLSNQLGASPVPGFLAPVPLSQSELASLIGATRETTSMTLNQLRRRGLVQLKRRCMLLPAPAAATQAA